MRAASRCQADTHLNAYVSLQRWKHDEHANGLSQILGVTFFKIIHEPLIGSLGHRGYLIIFLGATLGAAASPRLVACPRAQLKEKKRP